MNKNAEEWMDGLWFTAVECNYKEIDSQLKEESIHGLNDKKMLAERIKELTKTKDNKVMTSEQVLALEKKSWGTWDPSQQS